MQSSRYRCRAGQDPSLHWSCYSSSISYQDWGQSECRCHESRHNHCNRSTTGANTRNGGCCRATVAQHTHTLSLVLFTMCEPDIPLHTLTTDSLCNASVSMDLRMELIGGASVRRPRMVGSRLRLDISLVTKDLVRYLSSSKKVDSQKAPWRLRTLTLRQRRHRRRRRRRRRRQ
jgi:hypothetical protein